ALGRVRRVAARVTDRGRIDPRHLPENTLGAPETAEAEERQLQPLRVRRRERSAEHEMTLRHGERSRTADQSVLRTRNHQFGIAKTESHGCRSFPVPTPSPRTSWSPGRCRPPTGRAAWPPLPSLP